MDKIFTTFLANLLNTFLFVTTVSASTVAKPSILVVGDSLSAAYNMPEESGWVSLLQHRLTANNFSYQVVNASISGDTTAGGANRISKALKHAQPSLTIIGLGANDGLRGLSLLEMKKNLDRMIDIAKSHGSQVLLVGINLPPNYGPKYTNDFVTTFRELADRHQVNLVPSLLDGFEDDPAFFQADQIHPSIDAQSQILDNVWPSIKTMLSIGHD